MTKKLNEQVIQNELNQSAFFQKAQSPIHQTEDKTITKATPSENDPMPPCNHDTVIPRYYDLFLEDIRKALKTYGKEAATHRFTFKEKKELADLIYKYRQKGVRTNENEIARIAINFIINDQKELGEDSILDIVLKLLNS